MRHLPLPLLLLFAFALTLGESRPVEAQDEVGDVLGGLKDSADQEETTVELLPPSPDSQLGDAFEGDSLWQTFFDREEIGFDGSTAGAAEDGTTKVIAAVVAWWWALQADPFGSPLRDVLPFALLLLAIVLHIAVDKRLERLLPMLAQRIEERLPAWLVRPVHAMVEVLTAIGAPVVLLLLGTLVVSFFQAQETPWGVLVEQALLALVLFRLGRGLLQAILDGTLLNVDPTRVRGLYNLVLWSMWLVLLFRVAMLVVAATGYRQDHGDDVTNALLFLNKVTIAIIALRLTGLKSQVMELLPEGERLSLSERLRTLTSRYYGWVIGVSILLTLLWAIGFTNAATYLLTRVYAIMAVLAVTGALQRRFEAWFRKERARTLSTERKENLRRLERMTMVGGLCVLAAVLVWLLGLQNLALELLQVTILRVGSAHISLYSIVKSFIVFGTFLLISRTLRPFLNDRVYPRLGVEVGVGYAINTVAHYALFMVGLLAGLIALGVELGALTVFAGALGVGIGFGLQDITRNLVSGFILLFGRSVKKGDVVKVDEHFGTVEGLGARAVHLVTPSNQEIVIPSSRLVSSSITNYTYSNPTVRVHVPVGVHYNSDVRRVEQALLNAAYRHHEVLHDPPPNVWLKDFGDNSVNFELLVWIDVRRISIDQLTGELNFHVWDVLKEQQVEIPYPQRDLHLRAGPLIEDLVRAMRGLEAADLEVSPAAPSLKTYHSYLYDHDNAPRVPQVDVRNELSGRLRGERDVHRRVREFRVFTERFFTGREASLTKVATKVGDYVSAQQETEAFAPDGHGFEGLDAVLDALKLHQRRDERES